MDTFEKSIALAASTIMLMSAHVAHNKHLTEGYLPGSSEKVWMKPAL
jgi:hypothetical protein